MPFAWSRSSHLAAFPTLSGPAAATGRGALRPMRVSRLSLDVAGGTRNATGQGRVTDHAERFKSGSGTKMDSVPLPATGHPVQVAPSQFLPGIQ